MTWKVFVWQATVGEDELKYSTPGSAMHKAYENMVQMSDKDKYVTSTKESLDKIITDPTFVLYAGSSSFLPYPELTVLSIVETIRTDLSIALQKDSEFTKLFDYQIQKLIQSGLLVKMRHKWLQSGKPTGGAGEEKAAEAANPLGYSNLLFPFLCLFGGVAVSGALSFVEFVTKKLTVVEI